MQLTGQTLYSVEKPNVTCGDQTSAIATVLESWITHMHAVTHLESISY